VSKTETSYDEYDVYPLVTYTDLLNVPDYINPNTTVRGNATTTKRYYDLGANLYLETHARYDQCGNVVTAYNERGIQTQTAYSSDYKHAYPTQITTAIPDPSGAHGSNSGFNSSSTYDPKTGLVLTATDVNGQVTSFSYQDDQGQLDPLNRLRKITRPDGGWSKTVYHDVTDDLYVYTETQQDAARVSKSFQYYDRLGRLSRTYAYESGTTYNISDTQYDQMGRVWRVSSPYRGQLGSTINPSNHWTTNTYDPLGRVTDVTFSDTTTNWTVHTAYQGVYTTVTDQALKLKRQKVDALGRIVRVDEPDGSGSLDTSSAPVTTYDYDVL
jgi:hypothetical protein